ncbi:hypothetical protein WJX81_007462 [Elliptochloris bilobata]|uniref:Uncharacterized protein n=1 Tax=Elliptochloris bilobata TaxID=381761 RepID=A0AAW1RAP2_9CHLO
MGLQDGRVLSIQLLHEGGEGVTRQHLWADWNYSAGSVVELLKKHMQLRGDKACHYVLHTGDFRTATDLRSACGALSVRVACDNGAPQSVLGRWPGSGPPQRAADALRRLLAALGMHLCARCEPVDADDTVEDFALPFVPLMAVVRTGCREVTCQEALSAAGEDKPELIAALTPIAVDTLPPVVDVQVMYTILFQ